MNSPRVCCCVLNYQGTDGAIRAVRSLQSQSYKNIEIAVIENGSTGGEFEILKEKLPEVTILHHSVNQGFAGGMNLGLSWFLKQPFDFVWLITKDLTLEPECLENLLQLWPQLETPGFLGSLTDLNGTDEIYFMQAKIENSGRVRHVGENSSVGDWPQLRQQFGITDYVNGSCVFTHRSVLAKVGLIPEEYFLYYEDTEWGLRALRLGYKNYVCYKSRAHHHRGSQKTFSRTAEYYCRRNTYLFKERNGFAKPWTKYIALYRNYRHLMKAKFKKQPEVVDVLRNVCKDLSSGLTGLGPYR